MANERDETTFYKAHKDDPDVWGDGEKFDAPRQRKGLSATITVRFASEEADAIRRLAQAKHVFYSDIVREAVKAYTHPRFSVEITTKREIVTHVYNQQVSEAGETVEVGGELGKIVAATSTRALASLY